MESNKVVIIGTGDRGVTPTIGEMVLVDERSMPIGVVVDGFGASMHCAEESFDSLGEELRMMKAGNERKRKQDKFKWRMIERQRSNKKGSI